MAATPGLPPIQHVAVLTDRRHVLTQDAEGTVLMWDVSTGKPCLLWPASPAAAVASAAAGWCAAWQPGFWLACGLRAGRQAWQLQRALQAILLVALRLHLLLQALLCGTMGRAT